MNSIAWLQLLNLFSNSQSNYEQIQFEKKAAFECIQKKECHSEWREDIGEWVVVPNSSSLNLSTNQNKNKQSK